MCSVCRGLFVLPLSVIGRLSSATVALHGQCLYNFNLWSLFISSNFLSYIYVWWTLSGTLITSLWKRELAVFGGPSLAL